MALLANRSPTAWAPHALPSIVVLTSLPSGLSDPQFALTHLPRGLGTIRNGPGNAAEHTGAMVRLYIDSAGIDPQAVLLPLDLLFEHRASAAVRVWRVLLGRPPRPNPAALSKARQDRLLLALRALDGRLEGASHREIAQVLFGAPEISGRAWKTHDLRDRTFRLVRFGFDMMHGGYRSLLLHPYRRRR